MTATTPATTAREDAESTREIVRALNRCIETCTDGEKGYGTAAADVRDPELKALYLERARQRSEFVLALQDAVLKLGATPENEGTFRGPLHRGWMSYRRAIEGHDDHATMQGCAYGERAALRAYEAADSVVLHAVPPEIRALIQKQFAAIREAHADLRARLASRPG
jgi:uncharacterized protein (TIGR02284 family)